MSIPLSFSLKMSAVTLWHFQIFQAAELKGIVLKKQLRWPMMLWGFTFAH